MEALGYLLVDSGQLDTSGKALVNEELARLLDSPQFLKSPVLARLLCFLVREDMAGRSGVLKETYIGHMLFQRALTYDPKLDSVVRVSANRLRLRLDEYYETQNGGSFQIRLRRGSYVPLYAIPEISSIDIALDVAAAPEAPVGIAYAVPPVLAEAAVKEAYGSEPRGLEFQDPEQLRILPRGLKWSLLSRGWIGAAIFIAAVLIVGKIWPRTPLQEVWRAQVFSALGGSEEFSAFSPDGSRLAFAWSKHTAGSPSGIYLQELGADTPVRLTPGNSEDSRPAWSPDGSRIAFIRLLPDAGKELRTISVADRSETRIALLAGTTPWLCQVPRVTWSKDGQNLFTSESLGAGEACGIVSVDVRTGSLHRITEPTSGIIGDFEAAVSPDGTRIAFLRNTATLAGDVYTVDLEGKDLRRITSDDRDIVGFCWGADGRSLIVSSRREEGVMKLWRMFLDGRPAQQLTDDVMAAGFPAVDPTGDLIALTAYRNASSLWRVSGTGAERLIDDSAANSTPQLSPDGSRLLYRSDRVGRLDLWVSQANGQNSRQLTFSKDTIVNNPSWSRDGRSVYFECRARGHSDICRTSTEEGGAVERLTQWNSNQILPSLSHDGKTMYFTSNYSGRWQVYKQSASTSAEPVLMSHRGAMRAVESWDGEVLYIFQSEPLGGLFCIPIESGSAVPDVCDGERVFLPELKVGQWGDWDASPEGIWYISSPSADNQGWVMSYNIRTGVSRKLFPMPGTPPEGDVVFSVNPDGHSILTVQQNASGGELVLLRNRGAQH